MTRAFLQCSPVHTETACVLVTLILCVKLLVCFIPNKLINFCDLLLPSSILQCSALEHPITVSIPELSLKQNLEQVGIEVKVGTL
jgi:hypothetical protein